MMLIGTFYLAEDINFVRAVLSDPNSRTLCMSVDEADDTLEQEFPRLVQKSTILCAPPSAIYKEIDGDADGFVSDYLNYLNSPGVVDFLSAMLYYMHTGGNILLYIPQYTEDSIWVNVLCNYLNANYGIIAGSSAEKPYYYDQGYDFKNLELLYEYGYMSMWEFIASLPPDYNAIDIKNPVAQQKVLNELSMYCAPNQNVVELFSIINRSKLQNNLVRPALVIQGGNQ